MNERSKNKIYGCWMLRCNGGVRDDYYYKARIFITNRLQNYFAMINRNHNPDKTCWIVSWLGLISWSTCMSPCRLVTAVRDSSRKMALYSPPLPAASRLMQSGVLVLRAEQLTACLLELPVYATTGNPVLSALSLEIHFDNITYIH